MIRYLASVSLRLDSDTQVGDAKGMNCVPHCFVVSRTIYTTQKTMRANAKNIPFSFHCVAPVYVRVEDLARF